MNKYFLRINYLIFSMLINFFVGYAQEKDTLSNTILQLGLEKLDKTEQKGTILLQTTSIASKAEEKTTEAPAVVQVVSREEIQAFGGNTIGDVLNRLTNFYLASPTHLFNNMTSMRGDLTRNYSSHVLLLLNGRPVRESLFGGVDMAFLNGLAIEDIERIELIRGAGSILYGSGAFTGVINFIMRNEKETGTSVQTRVGAAGTRGIIFTQSYSKDNFTFHASARYYGQEGWESTYKDRDTISRTMKGANENFGVYASAESKKFTLRLYYGGTRANVMNNESKWSINNGNPDVTISRRGFIDLGFRHNFSKKWNMAINNTSNTHNIDFSSFDDNKMRFNTFDNLTEMTHFIRPVKNLNVLVGALYNLNSNNGKGSVDKNFNPIKPLPDSTGFESNYAFYTQADYRLLTYFKIVAGTQINKTSQSGWDIAPRVGLITTLPMGLGAKALYGKAFRTSAHLDVDYQSKKFINPEGLRPETVYTTDLQLFYERPKFYAALTYYHSQQTDVVEKELLANDQYTYSNEHDLTLQGIEAEAKYSPTSRLLLTANFSYYHSRDNEGKEYTTAVPAITTCAGVAYFSKNRAFSIGLYNVYFSKPHDVINAQLDPDHPTPDSELRKIVNPVPEAFDMISFNVSLDIATAFHIKNMPKTIFTVYGENLLDSEVWQPEYFRRNINAVPYQGIGGRAFYATLGVKF
jgi:outer membrane receptor for ferrienterochelin and colicins